MLGRLLQIVDEDLIVLSIDFFKFLERILWALLPRRPLILVRMVAESAIFPQLLRPRFLLVAATLVVRRLPLAVEEEGAVELTDGLHLPQLDSQFLLF